MGSFSEEEYRFFDAQEEIASISNVNSDSDVEISDSNSNFNNWVVNSFQYDVWIRSPRSVKERRNNFLNWMGVPLDPSGHENLVDFCGDVAEEEVVDRIRETSGAVLRTSGFEGKFCSSRSSTPCCSCDNSDLLESSSKMDFVCRDGMGGGMEHNVCEVGHGRRMSENCEVDLKRLVMGEGSGDTSRLSLSFQQLMENEVEEANNTPRTIKRVNKGWLSRLRSFTCIMDRHGEADRLRSGEDDAILESRVQRVKVRQCKKRSKELSALFRGQDIQAHAGSILAMKFSPDGQYLASGGEDGIVRLWQVVEDERSNELDIPEIDPSCMYFAVNHLSELTPLFVDKDKIGKLKNLRKTSDSACIIFPPKVFRLLEKPLHEFRGHGGEILDLSWSKNNYLLSSSIDKTVRLWQVGFDQCLKVFSHSNYVTCVQFNPVDDNYFISGSIDGKVRIWAISGCQVVDWNDIREIVTAVCYRPDGQGGIVGSITGYCRFYHISDNSLQLDAQICLHSKKKSPCKRITGFEFFPQDFSKVMVTCADSQVRILHGLKVVGKFKGLRNSGNQICASFTADGKHIVSACEDANVYVWNCCGQEDPTLSQAKSIKSCEHFAANASIAIPWSGLKYGNSENEWQFSASDKNSRDNVPFSSPVCFTLSQEFFLESFPRGSATWPEEKLPASNSMATPSTIRKSQYKFLKCSCQSTSSSHAWGLVIVTAGWDGRIRSFHNYGLPIPV